MVDDDDIKPEDNEFKNQQTDNTDIDKDTDNDKPKETAKKDKKSRNLIQEYRTDLLAVKGRNIKFRT